MKHIRFKSLPLLNGIAWWPRYKLDVQGHGHGSGRYGDRVQKTGTNEIRCNTLLKPSLQVSHTVLAVLS